MAKATENAPANDAGAAAPEAAAEAAPAAAPAAADIPVGTGVSPEFFRPMPED